MSQIRNSAKRITRPVLVEWGDSHTPSDQSVREQSYQIARGVRSLALIGQCDAGARAMSRVRARLDALAETGAVSFLCDRGDGSAEYGYAAAQWAIDLYRWVVSEKADDTVPSDSTLPPEVRLKDQVARGLGQCGIGGAPPSP